MTRLVDQVHVFNSAGLSALSEDMLTAEIETLRQENLRLKRLLKTAQRRLLENTFSESAN